LLLPSLLNGCPTTYTVEVSELQTLQKAFKVVDKDKSGDLDFDEFKALMKKEMKSEMSEESLKVCTQLRC